MSQSLEFVAKLLCLEEMTTGRLLIIMNRPAALIQVPDNTSRAYIKLQSNSGIWMGSKSCSQENSSLLLLLRTTYKLSAHAFRSGIRLRIEVFPPMSLVFRTTLKLSQTLNNSYLLKNAHQQLTQLKEWKDYILFLKLLDRG